LSATFAGSAYQMLFAGGPGGAAFGAAPLAAAPLPAEEILAFLRARL